jgi:hypothetical protein
VTPGPGDLPAFVRRAGSGRLPVARRLTWTVADGSRGRRWRAVTISGDRMLHAILLEAHPDGRVAKLEVAAPDGLLTLHPADDGTMLHGNVVRADGIQHVSLPWSDEHILMVGSSRVTAAVAAGRLAARIGVGEGTSVPAVEVGDALAVRRATWRAARTGERRWQLLAADAGPVVVLELDADGVPADLDDAEAWPLEAQAGR